MDQKVSLRAVEQPAPPTALHLIQARINGLRQQMDVIADRTEQVLHRAFGPEPVAQNPNKAAAPEPFGEIAEINSALNALESVIEAQRAQVDRLEGLV